MSLEGEWNQLRFPTVDDERERERKKEGVETSKLDSFIYFLGFSLSNEHARKHVRVVLQFDSYCLIEYIISRMIPNREERKNN